MSHCALETGLMKLCRVDEGRRTRHAHAFVGVPRVAAGVAALVVFLTTSAVPPVEVEHSRLPSPDDKPLYVPLENGNGVTFSTEIPDVPIDSDLYRLLHGTDNTRSGPANLSPRAHSR